MEFLKKLENKLNEYYNDKGEQGVVNLLFTDQEDRSFSVRLASQAIIDQNIALKADAEICLSFETMLKALQDPTTFEPRSKYFSVKSRVSGNQRLIHRLTQLIKRPNTEVFQAMEDLRMKLKEYATRPHIVYETSSERALSAIQQSEPTIFKNAVNWPALHWDINDLREKIGPYSFRFNPKIGKNETFEDLIHSIQISDRAYTNGCLIPDELHSHFPFGEFAKLSLHSVQLWLGSAHKEKPITRLHCDFASSLLFQVMGKKTVDLYAPNQHKWLYLERSCNMYQPSLVQVHKPDYKEFPLFKNAKKFSVEINPGDLLIIPKGWFHCVWASETVFSISCFYNDRL
ncbi:MAG: cupin-like domain-containing protein [Deltaproteobacteria bacterium]|nr:cupin-like domain-containing protein [Deltaproteobacteria bacterium]